jgi:hypothetical protein
MIIQSLKFCTICFLFSLFAFSSTNAQVSGGGSLEKPVASQLGGLVSSKVFKQLSNTPVKPKAKTTGTKSKSGSKTKQTAQKNKTTIAPGSVNVNKILNFQPVPNTGIERELAETFSQNPTEQATLIELFNASKEAYEGEVAKTGKKNDIAMAITFFIATCVTVYHDSSEPSETALDNLYNTLAELLVADGSIAKTSNIDKQILHDRLIYISGLVLGGYASSKQQNDAASLKTFQLLAGVCLKSLMQLEPDKLSFNQTGLVVKN